MLSIKLLREKPEFVIERLAVKNFDAKGIIDEIIEQDKCRRAYQTELDASLAEQKNKAKEIGSLMKSGDKDGAEKIKSEVAALKERSKELEKLMSESQEKQNQLVVLLPNLPCELVPNGKGAEDNVVVKQEGEIPHLPEGAKPHWDLAKQYDLIDFDLGVKLTGAGFPV